MIGVYRRSIARNRQWYDYVELDREHESTRATIYYLNRGGAGRSIDDADLLHPGVH